MDTSILDTIDISSIITCLIFDNLFFNDAFALSLKPSNFTSGSIPSADWMVVPSMFPDDIPVGPSKRTQSFSVFLLQLKRKVFEAALYNCLYKMRFTCTSTSWKKYVN